MKKMTIVFLVGLAAIIVVGGGACHGKQNPAGSGEGNITLEGGGSPPGVIDAVLPLPPIDVVKSITYKDAAGQVAGVATFEYDSLGRLSRLTIVGSEDPGSATITYGDAGADVQIWKPALPVVTAHWTFDAAGLVTRVDVDRDPKFDRKTQVIISSADIKIFVDADDNGSIEGDSEAMPFITMTITRDAQGRLQEVATSSSVSSSDLNRRRHLSYDSSSCIDIIENFDLDAMGAESLRARDDYDCFFEDGKLARREQYDNEDDVRTLAGTIDYSYDAQGKLNAGRSEGAGRVSVEEYTYTQVPVTHQLLEDPLSLAMRGMRLGSDPLQKLIYPIGGF